MFDCAKIINFILEILTPAVIVAIIAIIINVFITIGNVVLFYANRRNQRTYDAEVKYYQLFVLESLKEFIGFGTFVSSEFKRMLEKRNAMEDPDFLKVFQECDSNLEIKFEEFSNSTLPLIYGYSQAFGYSIEKEMEQFNDEAAHIFSKCVRQYSKTRSGQSLQELLADHKKDFYSKVFSLVKQYAPST